MSQFFPQKGSIFYKEKKEIDILKNFLVKSLSIFFWGHKAFVIYFHFNLLSVISDFEETFGNGRIIG